MTPRGWASREEYGGRRRDRGSRRGLGEATSNGDPQGALSEGETRSAFLYGGIAAKAAATLNFALHSSNFALPAARLAGWTSGRN